MIYPCKDCTDRTLGCHSICDKYISFKETRDKKKALMYKDIVYNSYKIKAVDKARRK